MRIAFGRVYPLLVTIAVMTPLFAGQGAESGATAGESANAIGRANGGVNYKYDFVSGSSTTTVIRVGGKKIVITKTTVSCNDSGSNCAFVDGAFVPKPGRG